MAASQELALRLLERLPAGVEVRANRHGLFIFRREIVEPILSSDPRFYRPAGEDTWTAIQRVSPEENGELLGYGARSILAGEIAVRIFAADNPESIFAGFYGRAEDVELCARARAREIQDYIGREIHYSLSPVQGQRE